MADFRLVVRDPDKAYVSDKLWLPKKLVAEQAIKEALQYWDVEKGRSVLCRLWDESRHHIICPREYIRPEHYPNFSFPFVDLTPRSFPRVGIHMRNPPRDEKQEEADRAFSQVQAGVLNLGCGKGKTYLALKKIADLECPGLIIVHNSFLFHQWLDEAIPTHVELPPGSRVGVIQGDKFDWEQPLTVAMIQTLANRVDRGDIPPEFAKHFGVVVYDEVHHLSAPVFVKTASLIKGQRYGLSATPYRLDGMEFVYFNHVGPVFYQDVEQDLIPRVYFQHTPVHIDLDQPEVKDVKGEVSIAKIRTFLSEHPVSMDFRYECIKEAVGQGRKVLCIGHSKNMLVKLHELFPDSGLIIQKTPQAERPSIVRKSQVCFAIHTLGVEGLDDDQIDTLFILTPFSSPNDLQQVLGRVQRQREGKSTPVVVVFEDVKVRPLKYLCDKLKKHLKGWNLDFTILDIPTR